MKKRIRTNRLHRYILASWLIMVSFGIWISCSKDTGVSSISPTDDGVSSRRSVGTKPAVGGSNHADFHPQTNVNYDPFAGMNNEDRKEAIGGRAAGEKYFQVIIRQLVNVMNDDDARQILHSVVPKSTEGEIHLAQVAIEHPAVLSALSAGFNDAVAYKNIGGALSNEISNTASDGESILKAAKAMVDLVIMVALPDGQKWDVTEKIPVFYVPLEDESVATVMNGVDADLNPVTLAYPGLNVTYPFLLVHVDENSSMIDGNADAIRLSMVPAKDKGIWDNILRSFNSFGLVPRAYAHETPVSHNPHYYFIQPAREVTIFNTHEDATLPDIKMDVNILVKDIVNSSDDWYHEDTFDLENVDHINVPYTDYENFETDHGTATIPNGNYIQQIYIYETDFWNSDDPVCTWTDILIVTPGSTRRLTREQADPGDRDAEIRIRKKP